uniref:Uncharacterized protein n=1 Tax=Rhizophora mucronata TaxID=61149 RepID=A0A2P2P170_RHIMU
MILAPTEKTGSR